MAKNQGKVIKRRQEGLLCNSLKETYLHDDTLRPALFCCNIEHSTNVVHFI